eukprot:COSAG01_NODE_15104_length_1374_cov_1.060392_2_plen_74_part_00
MLVLTRAATATARGCCRDEDGIVSVPREEAGRVLLAAAEIRQMENGIFAGTLTPHAFDAVEARTALAFVRKKQ